MPNIYLFEAFTWCGSGNIGTPGLTTLLTRYNAPAAFGGENVTAGAGRFGTNAFSAGGGGIVQPFNIPNGPFSAPIRLGCAVRATQWATSGLLMALSDQGSGLPGGHQNLYIGVGVNNNGQLTILEPPINLLNQGTVVATGSHILQNGSYYYIEVELVNISATVGVVNVYLDGALECTYTGNTEGVGGLSGSIYQFYLCAPQAGGVYYFSDLYISDTRLGPLHTQDATPIADGALVEWTPLTGTSHYPMVNSEPPGGDTAYESTDTPGNIDLFVFTPLAVANNILGVQVAMNARKDDLAAHTIAAEIRSGGTNYAGSTLPALTTSYLSTYLQVFNNDPNTAAPWLLAGLNAAQFGYQLVS